MNGKFKPSTKVVSHLVAILSHIPSSLRFALLLQAFYNLPAALILADLILSLLSGLLLQPEHSVAFQAQQLLNTKFGLHMVNNTHLAHLVLLRGTL